MARVDKSVIARFKKGGDVFEVLVDCDRALDYRAGKLSTLDDVLASKGVFKDVKKGLKAPEHLFLPVFKTEDPLEICAMIVKQGEIQLTAEHRETIREDKWKQIVTFIHRNAVDPKTGLPHPATRVDMAMKEAKVKVDEFKPVDMQIPDVITKLRPKLALRLETREIEIVVPAKYASPSLNIMKRLAKVTREEWKNDGSLRLVFEIPAGIQEEIETEVNKLTRGDAQITILSKK